MQNMCYGIFYCRNKVRNASQLLTVIAYIYNSYLHLRLFDVIVKRNASSKTASQVKMELITHEEGIMFSVLLKRIGMFRTPST